MPENPNRAGLEIIVGREKVDMIFELVDRARAEVLARLEREAGEAG